MVFSVVNGRQFLAHEDVTRGCEASNLGERYLQLIIFICIYVYIFFLGGSTPNAGC